MDIQTTNDDSLIGKDFGDYTIHQFIGEGTFGKVYRGTCKSAREKGGATFIPTSLALKLINLAKSSVNKKQQEWLDREISILNDPELKNHPNIVKYVEFFNQDKYLFIVMEFYEGGTLYDYVRHKNPIQERAFLEYLGQLVNGLEFLHTKKIIHRDVKTKNILLSATYELKLSDFGVARKVEEVGMKLTKSVGSPNYMSPEMLMKKDYDFKTDIWSLACVCYEMATREYAVRGSSFSNITAKVNSRELPNISAVSYSQPVKQIIQRMFEIDPVNRPTALEVKNFVAEQLPNTIMTLPSTQSGVTHGSAFGTMEPRQRSYSESVGDSVVVGSTYAEHSNLEKQSASMQAKIIKMIGRHNATGNLQTIMTYFNHNDTNGLKTKVKEVLGDRLAEKLLPFILALRGIEEGIREIPGHEEAFSTAPAE